MNNVERGKLLADLFPNEVQGILNAIQAIYKMLKDNESEVRADWDNGFISADAWYRLADEVTEIVQKEGDKLLRSKRFSEQLFSGYYAIFTIDCIVKYADRERNGSNFHFMTKALFE